MGQIEWFIAVCISALVTFVISADPPGGYYQTKYDALDVEDVLNHKRLVLHYGACLLNRGPCPPQGTDLKRILPEALETKCLRCTEKQKYIALRTIRRLRKEYPKLWQEIVEHWDPTGKYIDHLEESLDTTLNPNDIPNLISNRFNEDSENDVAPTVPDRLINAIFAKPSSKVPSITTTTKPTTTKGSKPIHRPSSSVMTTYPATYPASGKPEVTATPTFLTTWQLLTSPSSIGLTNTPYTTALQSVSYPYSTQQTVYYRPPQTHRPYGIPMLNVNAGIRFLGSIAELGTRVLKVGTEVASMVISSVQELVNH